MSFRTKRVSGGMIELRALLGVMVAVVVSGCCLKEPQTAPPPVDITDPTDPGQHAAVVAYAQSLSFLTHDSIRGSADKQPLDLSNGMSGCVGEIMPEKNAHNNSFDLLRGDILEGGGVITVAFQIDPKDDRCRPYQAENLRLPVGLSWVWVGNLDLDSTWVEDGQLYSPAQALVIPEILDERALVPVPIKVCRHPEYSFNHSQANWTFDPADAGAWWTCARFGCCNGG